MSNAARALAEASASSARAWYVSHAGGAEPGWSACKASISRRRSNRARSTPSGRLNPATRNPGVLGSPSMRKGS